MIIITYGTALEGTWSDSQMSLVLCSVKLSPVSSITQSIWLLGSILVKSWRGKVRREEVSVCFSAKPWMHYCSFWMALDVELGIHSPTFACFPAVIIYWDLRILLLHVGKTSWILVQTKKRKWKALLYFYKINVIWIQGSVVDIRNLQMKAFTPKNSVLFLFKAPQVISPVKMMKLFIAM